MLSRMIRSLTVALAIVASVADAALAQSVAVPVPTIQAPNRQDGGLLVATSATSAGVITLGPIGGNQVAYITSIEITNCAGASAVTAAAPTTISTTNLGGAAWTVGSGTTAGACQPPPAQLNGLLKSSPPGQAPTITLPTFATNQTIRFTAYYYLSTP
jgi:hypothetical protein